jgi:serine phosphatase RsbU (regulator of sigma subunit)
VGFLFSLKDLPAKEMGLKIISEIDRFTGDIKANDDLSVIILKRN